MRLPITASTLALLLALSSPAAAKPKYGPEAKVLSKSHEYVAKHTAPDYWTLIPYSVGQQSGSACSIASVTMVVNAALDRMELTSDDQLASQNSVLKKVGDESWSKAVGTGGGGVNLSQLGPLTERALRAHGFPKASAEVTHAKDTGKAIREKLHRALVENEKSPDDYIIANFIQGAYTGDADVGHIAPIAAYDEKHKRVLVLDPDREWYQPYWVSEETLLKGMATLDKSSGKNRGFVWVKLNP